VIEDNTEEDFLRHWSERAYDEAQLAAISAIEQHLLKYAMTAWIPMRIEPPTDVMLLTACDEGLVLMTKNQMDEWRTSQGQPHKPPYAWRRAPKLPVVSLNRRKASL
jgi:hypothetical protein